MRGWWCLGAAVASLAFGAAVSLPQEAVALESTGMFIHAVNPRGKMVTRAQVDRYVERRLNLFAGKGGKTISMLQLNGRMSRREFAAANTKPLPDPTVLSRSAFKAYANKLFTQAYAEVPPGKGHHRGSLDADELKTPAGKKLIRLLE